MKIGLTMSLLDNNDHQVLEMNFLTSDYIHFEVQGRLGTQLFGLSDAHHLSKTLNRKVLLDVSSVLLEYGEPDWLKFVEGWEWITVSKIPVIHTEDREYKKVNIGLAEIGDSAVNSHYFGFRPTVRSVEDSKLFTRGVFPFRESEAEVSHESKLGLCVRRGDYHQNPHLGILPASYYRKALEELQINQRNIQKVVFCDSKEETRLFLLENKIPFDSFDEDPNALNALRNLSSCTEIIGANSTFSFWGIYFSQSSSTVPYPFYISDPGWGLGLAQDSKIVRYTRFPEFFYFWRLVMQKVNVTFREKLS